MYERAIIQLSATWPQEINSLGTISAALTLWALPPDERLAALRSELTVLLQKKINDAWLARGPAHEVFTVMAALASQNPRTISVANLATIVHRLVCAEVAPGGPYAFNGRTSFGSNAAIAVVIAQIVRPLPHLTAFLQNQPHSDPHFYQTALNFLCSKINTTYKPPRITSFTPKRLVRGEPPSRLATTAVMTALHEHSAVVQSRAAVLRRARGLFAHCGRPTAQNARTLLAQVARADAHNEITMTTQFFASSLRRPASLSKAQLIDLDAAIVCGWAAYTVYDTFLDTIGERSQLPIANIAMRSSVAMLQSIAAHTAKPPDILGAFTTMDCANATELVQTRLSVHDGTLALTALPVYAQSLQLAARSIAHTLGPQIVLAASKATAQQKKTVVTALQHYLAARQLADDLHDWQEDIRTGQVSFVVAALLHKAAIPCGQHKLDVLIPSLQPVFTRIVLPEVSAQIHAHLAAAQQLLASTQLFKPAHAFTALIERLCNAAPCSGAADHDTFIQKYRNR